MSVNEVFKAIERGRKFLITSHINLEGDSLGSEIAIFHLLKKMNKPSFIYNASPIPRIYRFLPSLNKVHMFNENKKPHDFDTVIIVDCSDLNRTGNIKDMVTENKVVINIDHHMDNSNFGTVNLVNPKASAAGEIIYELFRKKNIPLDKDIALCLYVAIITDTGSFRYKNTTQKTHMIISRLMKYKVEPETVFEKIHASYSFSRMKLLGLALSDINIDKRYGIAWITVSQSMLEKTGANLEDVEGFIEMARSIEGINVAMLFQELGENKIKVGFRSKGRVNVNLIASYFGGGGHFAASGCTLEGSLDTVEKKVVKKVKNFLAK